MSDLLFLPLTEFSGNLYLHCYTVQKRYYPSFEIVQNLQIKTGKSSTVETGDKSIAYAYVVVFEKKFS